MYKKLLFLEIFNFHGLLCYSVSRRPILLDFYIENVQKFEIFFFLIFQLSCGVYYSNCLDYDLCEVCEARPGVHSEEHVFVKIRRPCYGVGVVDNVRRPLLKTLIYRAHKKSSTKLVVPIPTVDQTENELNFRLER